MSAGIIDQLLATFGPFAIAAAIFALGFVGYLALVVITRWRERR